MRKEKKPKHNLLEMPDTERNKLIKEIKEVLQQKVAEAKLWNSLLEAENLTINGKILSEETDY
jgi:hypothetical protein